MEKESSTFVPHLHKKVETIQNGWWCMEEVKFWRRNKVASLSEIVKSIGICDFDITKDDCNNYIVLTVSTVMW
jgi:hypothetical protein